MGRLLGLKMAEAGVSGLRVISYGGPEPRRDGSHVNGLIGTNDR